VCSDEYAAVLNTTLSFEISLQGLPRSMVLQGRIGPHDTFNIRAAACDAAAPQRERRSRSHSSEGKKHG
jgi:hypothetical protein